MPVSFGMAKEASTVLVLVTMRFYKSLLVKRLWCPIRFGTATPWPHAFLFIYTLQMCCSLLRCRIYKKSMCMYASCNENYFVCESHTQHANLLLDIYWMSCYVCASLLTTTTNNSFIYVLIEFYHATDVEDDERVFQYSFFSFSFYFWSVFSLLAFLRSVKRRLMYR